MRNIIVFCKFNCMASSVISYHFAHTCNSVMLQEYAFDCRYNNAVEHCVSELYSVPCMCT